MPDVVRSPTSRHRARSSTRHLPSPNVPPSSALPQLKPPRDRRSGPARSALRCTAPAAFDLAHADDHRHHGIEAGRASRSCRSMARCGICFSLAYSAGTRSPLVRMVDGAVHPAGRDRDTQAVHAKLDELLHAAKAARNAITRIDEQEPEDIERHRQDHRATMKAEARNRGQIGVPRVACRASRPAEG